MTSPKQIEANQKNAALSTGPKTDVGKAVAARNALKHGLLAKEVVITDGEGAEDARQFDAMLADLVAEFAPAGAMEEILVEKIAACYWRMRRAHRYEVGMLRQKLDTLSDDYYAAGANLTDTRIHAEIAQKQARLETARQRLELIQRARATSQDLAMTYDWAENWGWLKKEYIDRKDIVHEIDGFVTRIGLTTEDQENIKTPPQIRRKMNEKGHRDDQIWQEHSRLCREFMDTAGTQIKQLEKDKHTNSLCLQRTRQTGSLPPIPERDSMLRYETAIERQMYQALKQLERLQRLRGGDAVPPPLQVEVNLTKNE
jgi:hypothetical protein